VNQIPTRKYIGQLLGPFPGSCAIARTIWTQGEIPVQHITDIQFAA
jgi:hypothetical protein